VNVNTCAWKLSLLLAKLSQETFFATNAGILQLSFAISGTLITIIIIINKFIQHTNSSKLESEAPRIKYEI